MSGSFALGHAHHQTPFSACSRWDSPLKGCDEILGRQFEDETNPKHQYGSIRLAAGQKGH